MGIETMAVGMRVRVTDRGASMMATVCEKVGRRRKCGGGWDQ